MSDRQKVGSGAGGGVWRWSVLAGALAGTVVLVSLHLPSRSNCPLFHSIIEALERGYYRSDWERVAGSLDHGGGPGTVMGFIAGVPSLRLVRRRHCGKRMAMLPEAAPGNAAWEGLRE